MFLKRFYNEQLAQASYMIGCHAARAAIVVDPNRDTQQYLEAAQDEDVRITHVTETHIHADFVSGSLQLSRESPARLLLSGEGEGGDSWSYAFTNADGGGTELLHEGSSIEVGAVRIDVLHTPGHTPEHLTFLVTDTAAADQPMGAITGDFIFVGDVGRPDLLERAARAAGTMESSARDLFRSLQRFADLPAHLQIWPGHGAGSACGKSLGAMPQSTLGYEKLFNWAFSVHDEDAFVKLVLEGQPDPPTYFATMKRVNRDGPAILTSPPHPGSLNDSLLPKMLAEGALVVDVRAAADFMAGHIPGTLSIPLNRSFASWAGWILPYDRDLYLIVSGTGHDARTEADRATSDLALIGLDRVNGYFTNTAIEGWQANGGTLESVDQIDPLALRDGIGRGEVELIDVRSPSEWAAGHIAGARNIPLGLLNEQLDDIPRSRAVALQCASGARSAMASSILMAHGMRNVINVRGGIAEWRGAKLPLETTP